MMDIAMESSMVLYNNVYAKRKYSDEPNYMHSPAKAFAAYVHDVWK